MKKELSQQILNKLKEIKKDIKELKIGQEKIETTLQHIELGQQRTEESLKEIKKIVIVQVPKTINDLNKRVNDIEMKLED